MPTLTSFDVTFDNTFARSQPTDDTFPEVGGDGGGGIAGSVFPFATNPSLLASCLHHDGQGWERWSGVPIGLPGYLLPFVLAVPMPGNLTTSPYCTEGLQIVDADSGAVVLEPYGLLLYRLSGGSTLYIIHNGSQLYSAQSVPASLPTGTYRIQLGDAVSEPFGIRCGPCKLFRVRLLNDARLGDLLYGSYGFQQVFYVEGTLSGPTYNVEAGTDSTSKTISKIWTLSLQGTTEPIADALALAGVHRLVEVSIVNGSGAPVRSIQAMEFEAKGQITVNSSGGYDIELTLPVSKTSSGSASSTSNCAISGGSLTLTPIECEIT
ncbi:hypothetical protein [Spirosoma litoris]